MTNALPFQHQDVFTKEQHRILALAAVFQAAQLVHIIATKGTHALDQLGKQYVTSLVQASLNIRPALNPMQDSLLFFQSLSHLKVGLRSLERCIEEPYNPQPQGRQPKLKVKHGKQTLQYSMGLLHLSAKVYKDPKFRQTIEQSQQHIIRQLSFFNQNYQHQSILSALAQIYTDTASTIKPRIMVRGSAQAFNSPYEVACIRALLFTGLQAAHYWRGLGGSPWQLIFSKRKILKELKNFAYFQHEHLQISP